MTRLRRVRAMLRADGSWVGWLLPGLLVLLALGLWELAVRLADTPRWMLPTPWQIGGALRSEWGLLWQHTQVTLQEVAWGLALALASGVVLAALISFSRILERAIYPFVIASQTVPIIAIAPLLLIWLGYGVMPKVVVVALISFFPIVVNMVDGLRSADPDSVKLFRTMGAGRWAIFSKLRLPSALPFLFSGIKVAVAISVIGAVIGEWVGAQAGLGYLMVRSLAQFLTERVFAAIFILSVIGTGLFALVSLLERRLLPWHFGDRRTPAAGVERAA